MQRGWPGPELMSFLLVCVLPRPGSDRDQAKVRIWKMNLRGGIVILAPDDRYKPHTDFLVFIGTWNCIDSNVKKALPD